MLAGSSVRGSTTTIYGTEAESVGPTACWECSPLRVADHPLALHGQADHTPRAQVISPTAEAPNHAARFNSTGQPHPLRVVLGTNKRLPCVTLER